MAKKQEKSEEQPGGPTQEPENPEQNEDSKATTTNDPDPTMGQDNTVSDPTGDGGEGTKPDADRSQQHPAPGDPREVPSETQDAARETE